MDHRQNISSHEFRVPFRIIEAQLGRDRLDDAGDLMVDSLTELDDYPHRYDYEFSEDLSHSNPWYHCLIFIVWGLSETKMEEFQRLLGRHGLTVDSP